MRMGLFEAFMIVISAAGTWWSYRNTRESERDVAAVKASGENGLLLLTATTMRSHQRAFGTIAALVFVIMMSTIVETTPVIRGTRRLAFVGIVVAVVVGSGRADRHRQQIWRQVSEKYPSLSS